MFNSSLSFIFLSDEESTSFWNSIKAYAILKTFSNPNYCRISPADLPASSLTFWSRSPFATLIARSLTLSAFSVWKVETNKIMISYNFAYLGSARNLEMTSINSADFKLLGSLIEDKDITAA